MKNNIEEIIVALPTSPSPIERWKKLSLDFLFSKNNLNNFQNSKLLLFIENQMSMYNICDLSSSNTATIAEFGLRNSKKNCYNNKIQFKIFSYRGSSSNSN